MSHQINIAENGTTTLATAGKYCDRNIDVNVNVPSSGTELVYSIIERTIVDCVYDEITSVGAYCFSQCQSLESVTFANVAVVYGYSFDNCISLKRVELPMVRTIYNAAFRNCSKLEKLILRRNEVVKADGINTFLNTGIANGTGYVYVPDDLVDSYKTATNWSNYASQIKPLSELGE